MLTITARQCAEMVRLRRLEQEPGWVLGNLSEAYAESLSGIDQDLLRREIRACLHRCDDLGIASDADRLGFCM